MPEKTQIVIDKVIVRTNTSTVPCGTAASMFVIGCTADLPVLCKRRCVQLLVAFVSNSVMLGSFLLYKDVIKCTTQLQNTPHDDVQAS